MKKEMKCIECEEQAKVVKVARTSWSKKQGMETGMMWECKNGHRNRKAKK